MERPPEYLKPLADHIARVAASEDATEIVRLLRVSGLIGGSPNYDAVNAGDDVGADVMDELSALSNAGRFGIWERKVENGKPCFVRRVDTVEDWHYWSNLGRIEPKGNKRRVAYIGESVARGYLYDPAFTPAQVLQKILDTQFEDGEVEVIDLARTNLGFEVRELALAALQLEPDVAIIFAGNNWGVNRPEPTDIADIHEALSTQGMAGTKKISEAQIVKSGRRVVCDVSAAYKARGVPLIWMIPEFNLGDWRDAVINAPYLPGDLNRQWLSLLEEAQSALRDHDFDKAEKLGEQMIEIDRGVSVAGFYILAECRRAAKDHDGERKYRELARDAACWDSSMPYIPRPHALTQQIMRDEQSKYGYQTVDLPALLKQYLNGEIPDRRLFLDYCHLTTEGIQITMSAAASCVLRALKGIEAAWYTLMDEHMT
ncbi:MAG TPA: hypothetical protein VFY67_01340, partial [Pyrinomonadaceae bacterium]|nr:hypothetical protein [Pyrinomonadaceae bacterium]